MDSPGFKNNTVTYPFKPVNMKAQPKKKICVSKQNLFQH